MLSLFTSFGNLADRLICVAFAIVFAQVPVYMAQYIDVLAGAQMESGKMHKELEEVASNYNLRIPEYLDKLMNNPDPMVRDNVAIQKNAEDRYQKYSLALTNLTERSVWVRPFYLIRHYDPSIHAAMHFEPNFPFTWEGAIYAILGVIVALMLIGLVKTIAGSYKKSQQKKRDLYRPTA